MTRASSSSYQLPRPRHTVRLGQENFFRVDLTTKIIREQDGILYQPKQDYKYLGYFQARDVRHEVDQVYQEWYSVRLTKISQVQFEQAN